MNLPELRLVSIRKWEPFYEKRTLEKERAEVRHICYEEGVELEVVCDDLSTGLWVDSKPCPG